MEAEAEEEEWEEGGEGEEEEEVSPALEWEISEEDKEEKCMTKCCP